MIVVADFFQYSRLAVEYLNHGNFTSNERLDDVLRLTCRHIVIQAHELRQDPIEIGNHKRGVLQVRINTIAQVCSISLVPNVINDANSTRQMEPDAFRERP